ncbi:MAG: winged helix-turn-helix transcriptional regulator [Methylobacteriaceae bacterium]|nr:winged helix-turn-helix transcriptional regulator [Methylobacteriaceae bacterium]
MKIVALSNYWRHYAHLGSPSSESMGARSKAKSQEAFSLRGFLPYQLAVLADYTSSRFSEVYSEKFGLSIPEWRVLATVGERDMMRAKDIEAERHLHKTVVSRAIAKLRARGLIELRNNAEDRRESFLLLTAKGRKLYAQIIPLARTYSDEIVVSLTASQRAGLQRGLERMMQQIDEERQRPSSFARQRDAQ